MFITIVVDMCFFAEPALAEMHRRDVILYALQKSRHGLLREAFHGEGEGVNSFKGWEEKGGDRSWKMR